MTLITETTPQRQWKRSTSFMCIPTQQGVIENCGNNSVTLLKSSVK